MEAGGEGERDTAPLTPATAPHTLAGVLSSHSLIFVCSPTLFLPFNSKINLFCSYLSLSLSLLSLFALIFSLLHPLIVLFH